LVGNPPRDRPAVLASGETIRWSPAFFHGPQTAMKKAKYRLL
jgi:hypothetical protein